MNNGRCNCTNSTISNVNNKSLTTHANLGGPGYATPEEAIQYGEHEKLIFVTCPSASQPKKPDIIAVVDTDPESDTYSKIIGRLTLPNIGDEVHHSGWNSCSSCHNNPLKKRTHLIIPCLNSNRIYIINVMNPKKLKIDKIIEGEELKKLNISMPHTAHCLVDGNIMISTIGDGNGEAKGNFLLIDGKTFELNGTWPSKLETTKFGYDFWYQPRRNVMISSEWGNPNKIRHGFNLADLAEDHYGNKLYVWNWKQKKIRQAITLEGPQGMIPLEVRFLHEPTQKHAFVCTALGSTIYHLWNDGNDDDDYQHEVAVAIPPKKIENWVLPIMDLPSMITDIVISMDDRYLYLSNWIHGDIRQYDISDPFNFRLVGQIFIGGSIHMETEIKIIEDKELKNRPYPLKINNKCVEGAPQMLQLSLDGKRLYLTTSLYSKWDQQFYPKMIESGSWMLQIDVNTRTGGLKLNKEFHVDFSTLTDGPFLAHEMRYPGGDCTSDIWI